MRGNSSLAILFFISLFLLTSTAPLSYEKEKLALKNLQSEMKVKWNGYNDSTHQQDCIKQIGKIIELRIVNKLIPFWYGTEWDFNGYTAIPGKGKIACGYFVSTIMLHAGFNLNRYKLAQKYSFDEVESYSCGDTVYQYRDITKNTFNRTFKESMKDGLYIVGLDNHIGFLLLDNGSLYFIHSSYLAPSTVVKEKAEESLALGTSKSFVYTSITENETLLRKWIVNEKMGE